MGNDTMNVPSRRSNALRAAVAMSKSGETDQSKIREAAVSAANASDKPTNDASARPSNRHEPPADTQRQTDGPTITDTPIDGTQTPTEEEQAQERKRQEREEQQRQQDEAARDEEAARRKPKPKKKKSDEPEPDEPELPDDPRAALEQLVGQTDDDVPPLEEEEDETPPKKKDDDRPGVLPTDTESMRKRVLRFQSLLAESETAQKKVEQELEAARSQLKQVQQQPKVAPELEEELKTLRSYKLRYELENDPAIQAEFTSKIDDAESTITDIIKGTSYSWIADEAKKAGGFDKLFRTRNPVAVGRDDKGKEVEYTGAQLYKRMLEGLPAPDADMIRGEISREMSLRRERERTIAEKSKEVDSVIKKDQESAAAKEAERTQRKEAVNDVIQRFHSTAIEKLPWLKPEDIPQDIEGEERKARQSSNKVREVSGKLFKSYVDNPILREAAMIAPDQEALNTLGAILLDASRVFHVEHELKRAQTRIKQLDTMVQRLKGGARTTPRTTRTPPPSEPAKTKRPTREEGESHLRYGVRLANWQEQQAQAGSDE